jgi:hypothetical protein
MIQNALKHMKMISAYTLGTMAPEESRFVSKQSNVSPAVEKSENAVIGNTGIITTSTDREPGILGTKAIPVPKQADVSPAVEEPENASIENTEIITTSTDRELGILSTMAIEESRSVPSNQMYRLQ